MRPSAKQLLQMEGPVVRQLGEKRRGPTPDYNCHGLTFVNRLGWFATMHMAAPYELPGLPHAEAQDTDEHIRVFLRECSYRLIVPVFDLKTGNLPADHPVRVGDIVLYLDPDKRQGRFDHSGVVVEVISQPVNDLKILSKFGMNGEYVHLLRQVPPEYPNFIEIWTDREQP
jgi:hypothetical protein